MRPQVPTSPADLGAALLRVSLGAMFLAHSLVLKLLVFGLPGTAAYFGSIGLPPWTAYAVFAAEAVGGNAGRTVRYTVGVGRVEIRTVGSDVVII